MTSTSLRKLACIGVTLLGTASCGVGDTVFQGLPLETRFAFTNFSLTTYASLAIRAHGDEGASFERSPLLAPGATFRGTFLETLGVGCPDALDLRLWVYERIDADVPIGLDEVEDVASVPVIAGEFMDVPACSVTPVETYTIVSWETNDAAVARLKIAQSTPVEDAITESGIFDGIDDTWEMEGVAEELAGDAAPGLLDASPLSGLVTSVDGTGVTGVGVLVRTRFRVRLDDSDEGNDPDSGFGDPIAFTTTDENGAFSFDRPAGVYEVEFFSDDFAFRPDFVIVESPNQTIRVIAEGL